MHGRRHDLPRARTSTSVTASHTARRCPRTLHLCNDRTRSPRPWHRAAFGARPSPPSRTNLRALGARRVDQTHNPITMHMDLSALWEKLTQQILFHDQTEATDGDRSRQREGWPAGASKPVPKTMRIGEALRGFGRGETAERRP